MALIGLVADHHLRQPGGLILDSFMQQVNQLGYRGPYVPVENWSRSPMGFGDHG